jgi:hypothetical protein
MLKKIVKNPTNADIVLKYAGVTIPALGQHDIDPSEFPLWATVNVVEEINDHLLVGDLIVYNGVEDLEQAVGKVHLEVGTITTEKEVPLYAGAGETAGRLVELSPAMDAIGLAIGDSFKAVVDLEGLIGTLVNVRFDLAGNTAVADTWITFDIDTFSSTGIDNALVNTSNHESGILLTEIPAVPYQIFQAVKIADIALIDNGKRLANLGLKRVTTNTGPLGNKTDLSGLLYILRLAITYKRGLDI